jgi:DNA-binding HxlR family transcriptional regulator
MISRTYGQYCGVARALELVGERWALLVVRDLLLGPKRYGELRKGLPKVPSNILATRLKELEHAGVISRRLLPQGGAAVAYELTDYGRELEPILVSLGGWGVRSLGEPRADDVMNADSLSLALRDSFRASAARELAASFEVHLGDFVVHARVDHGKLEVARGPAPKADLVIEADLTIGRLIAGELTAAAALSSGHVRLTGKRRLFGRFVEVFRFER